MLFRSDQEHHVHRDDGPAVEEKDGRKTWYRHGQVHREDGPARIFPDGAEEWRLNGELHRDDGPAAKYADGSWAWFKHGRIHREDGQAVRHANLPRDYWLEEEWWLEGVKTTEEAVRKYAAWNSLKEELSRTPERFTF